MGLKDKSRQLLQFLKQSQFVRDWGIASISSVAFYLAFYPANLSFLAWVALVPWLVIAARRKPLRAGLISFAAGFVHFVLAVSWIGLVTYTGLIASAAVLSAFAGLFGILYSFSVRKLGIPVALAGPVLWVGVEYARSNFTFLAFPWMLAGHSQHAYLPLIQIADITGVFGVSFVVVLANAALAQALILRRFKEGSLRRVAIWGGVAAAVFALNLGYGLYRLGSVKWEEGPKLLVVQGNVPQDLKEESIKPKKLATLGRNMKREHIELAAEVFEKPSDLIVWPETMWPGALTTDPAGFAQVSALARQARTHILIGTQRYLFEDTPKRRNSAMLITPGGQVEKRVYDKMFLVPVSEYIPFEYTLPAIKFAVAQMMPYEAESLSHGTSMEVFDVAGAKFSVVICFELSLDWLVRMARNAGAQYVINISNDGWFCNSAELDLALGQGVFRAIENRMGVVRSVNTGISCFINPVGRVSFLEVGGRRKQVSGTLHSRVALAGGETVFSRFGSWFGLVNLLGAIAVAVYSCVAFARSKVIRDSKFR
jgi:apolipoprotein N-acyltransferase